MSVPERVLSHDFLLFSIYDSPRDYPGKFVVRQWKVNAHLVSSGQATFHESLEEAREKGVPKGFWNIGRYNNDDPCIVESWI